MLSKNDGVTSYSTIVSLSESPVVPGIVWVGTDDGYVQVSRDGGTSWAEVGRNIPGPALYNPSFPTTFPPQTRQVRQCSNSCSHCG